MKHYKQIDPNFGKKRRGEEKEGEGKDKRSVKGKREEWCEKKTNQRLCEKMGDKKHKQDA